MMHTPQNSQEPGSCPESTQSDDRGDAHPGHALSSTETDDPITCPTPLAIVLSTYNGARFLEEQIVSILEQSSKEWTLYIRDDGSSDDTWSIVQRFAERYPKSIIPLAFGPPSGGAKGGFSMLLNRLDADYFMTCDQDDVWLPEKVEKSLTLIRQEEAEHGETYPILLHSRLQVVDANLSPLALSPWNGPKGHDQRTQIHRLILQNLITGAGMAGNRALLAKASPLPFERPIIMHDWWLALVASLFGRIVLLNEPAVLYRQHDENVCGALVDEKHIGPLLKLLRLLRQAGLIVFHLFFVRNYPSRSEFIQQQLDYLDQTHDQTTVLIECYKDHIPTETTEILHDFTRMKESGVISRLILARKRGFRFGLLVRDFVYLFLWRRMKKQTREDRA
ncbi:MAG: glycosyltransferase family 2 protein [Magnetococcales bacterium]|nr:glycosyltransferase family 2 protein [Magnetococcales bacterium]